MPDRVKQSIFNILGSYYGTPGILPSLRVADVFAGSGSMGLEALSRGALRCTFFESDRIALAALRANIETLHAKDVSDVVTTDAWRSAAHEAARGSFDLVFLDPPYRDSDDPSPQGSVMIFLNEIAEKKSPAHLQANSRGVLPLVLLHHAAKAHYGAEALRAPWTIEDQRRFGTSAVSFFAAPS